MIFERGIERELLNVKIKNGAAMSRMEIYAHELLQWEHSPQRREMVDGVRYYAGEHDILRRKRLVIGKDGQLAPVDNLPNNRIVDNQYAKHVDQKANYLLGQPVAYKCDSSDECADAIADALGSRFARTLKRAGVASLNAGIAWLYPYYNDRRELDFRLYQGYEVLPLWGDADHTELDAALRLYYVDTYEGRERRRVKKVDIFEPDGVTTCTFDDGLLTPEVAKTSYIIGLEDTGATPLNWMRLPLIPIKCNADEIPLIRRGRSLQDAINLLHSDFANAMQENVHNTILVLKNYDGQDPAEARQNIAAHGIINITTVNGIDGDVSTLETTVNADNYRAQLDMLKAALIENLRSYDAKDEKLSGNPNQMNIQSMYCDIDLDANGMETELQAAFDEIMWFVKADMAATGRGNYTDADVEVIFNRDILINETEAIDNCAKSAGIISDETIVSMHPWVDDPAAELDRVKEQKEEADPYRAIFEQGQQGQPPTGSAVNEE